MISAWANDFPHIRWEWRLYCDGKFLTYFRATVPEILAAQAGLTFAFDVEYQTIDLL